MRVAVWTLALLVLTGARADRRTQESPSAHFQGYPDAEDGGNDACNDVQRRPIISTPVTDGDPFRNNISHVFFITRYGEDVTIFCSADSSANLKIRSGDNEHEATQVNSTTIQLAIRQLDVGRHVYSCSDNNCKDYLVIDVEPRISVAAAGERHTNGLILNYFVPVGEDYEVFCSVNDVKLLREGVDTLNIHSLTHSPRERNLEQLPTEILNRTTVRYKTRADRVEVKYYGCDDLTSGRYKLFIKVIIDNYPKADDFRCVSNERMVFECSWISLNETVLSKEIYVL